LSEQARTRHHRGASRQLRLALLVLAAGLLATALAAWQVARSESQRARESFEKHAVAAEDAVLARIDTLVALLRGAAGLMASREDTVSGEDFGAYVQRLGLRTHYPGLLGIGFSRRLEPAELAPFTARMRAEGHPDFHVWPDEPRDEYHAILHLEPLDRRNQAAIGYDMYTNPVRRAAMARARDRAAPAATESLTLVQEIDEDKQPGFLVYVPVYSTPHAPATPQARRSALVGFVYAPVRAHDFLSQAFAHEGRPAVSMDVYDGTEALPERRMFSRSAAGPDATAPRYRMVRIVDVAGTPWTVAFQSQVTRLDTLWGAIAVAVVGGLVSMLIAVLTFREAQARARGQDALGRERAARSDAERANLLKDEFLATLSHELRTPLNAILGWAHLLQRRDVAPGQVRKGLDAIDRNARAQVRLVDDLLDVSRVISGKLRLDVERVDLCQVVDRCIEALQPAADARGVRLARECEAAPDELYGDRARLQQVVWNLISNGIKFTPHGGSVRVAVESGDGQVRLVVRDTGEGIDAQFLPFVFDRFRQADPSRTRRHGGLGLGLAIVRHLVELHGGRVQAQSDGPGCGATFTVELPLGRAPPAAATPVPESRVPAAASAATAAVEPDIGGLRVLFVDDEPDARALVRQILEERHAHVRTAASAAEALAILREGKFEVLVSDIGMPGADGLELMSELRRLPAAEGGTIPAAAFTAYVRADDRAAAHAAGYQAYLTKPLDPGLLVRTIASLAGRAGSAGANRGPDAASNVVPPLSDV
jgi:signal transduction histidine kinase/ActR/RegA family two-component response regulator